MQGKDHQNAQFPVLDWIGNIQPAAISASTLPKLPSLRRTLLLHDEETRTRQRQGSKSNLVREIKH